MLSAKSLRLGILITPRRLRTSILIVLAVVALVVLTLVPDQALKGIKALVDGREGVLLPRLLDVLRDEPDRLDLTVVVPELPMTAEPSCMGKRLIEPSMGISWA